MEHLTTMPCDKILLQRIATGDAAALEELHSRHSAALEVFLERMVRDSFMAADLLQEVFLRVWERGAEQYTGTGTSSAWLFRIASNLALSYLESAKRRRYHALEPAHDDLEDSDVHVPAWLIDEAAVSADSALEALEERRLVRAVIDGLPEDKQRVIRMVYDSQLEVTEVAQQLGIPEGTVKSRLYYARRQVAAGWREIARQWEDE